MKDYYKILGVNKDSSIDEIKMAYKKLAMRYHPDRNPNDPKSEEKFKDVKEAYEFLVNKDKNPNNFSSDNINFSDFSTSESSLDDIFNVIFRKNFKRDNKIYFILDVDLECAVYGSFMNIKIPYQGNCNKCFGKGIKPGSSLKICPKCYGSGVYTIMQGIFNFKQKCYKCGGKGYVSTEICTYCSGMGKLEKTILCFAKLEKNSDNNSLITISNIKNFNIKEFNLENVSILSRIKPHPFFIRKNFKNNDLYVDFFIDFIKSVLGGYLKIFTLYGFVLYKIFKYTQNFKIYKLNNFGLNFNKNIGHLYINILIEVISNMSFYQWFLFNKLKLAIDSKINYFLIFNLDRNIKSFYSLVFNF